MRKILGFRLPLHFKEIRHRAKKSVDFNALGLANDAAFKAYLDETAKCLKPAVLFDTFPPDCKNTASLSPLPGLAHTLALITLGPDLPTWMSEKKSAQAPDVRLLEMIIAVSLESATGFVLSLIKEQANEERCDLSPIEYLNTPQALEIVHAQLDGAKIGVSLTQGRWTPEYTTAFCVSWVAKSKSRSKSLA